MMQFALASFVGTLTVAAPRILPMLLILLGATVAEALCVSWASRSVQWRRPVRIAGDSRMEIRSPGAAVAQSSTRTAVLQLTECFHIALAGV
jgi:hypothetical protein